MTIYTFPSELKPTSQSFELVTNTKQFQSPLSNAIQTVSRKGSYWKTTMRFSNITGDNRRRLQTFIARLDGQTHRMLLRDFGTVREGVGPVSDVIRVLGSGQTGTTLTVDGATPDINDYCKRGDYVKFNNELHIITGDVNSSATGVMNIPVAPPIRKSPSDNEIVVLSEANANGVFMMTNNPSWSTSSAYVSDITIEAIEDVLA